MSKNTSSNHKENDGLLAESGAGMTVKKTADYFDVCERTVWNWISDNELEVWKKGNVVRVTPSSIRHFLNKYKIKAAA